MANALVQFRADETARIKAISICERLGIDLQTYFRMCMSGLIQENGIPFSMTPDKESENHGLRAVKAAGRIAAENGVAEMTLDEINAEISAARE